MKNRLLLQKIFATGFGSGYAPKAPGTAASLLACFFLWGLNAIMPGLTIGAGPFKYYFAGIITIFLLTGIVVSNQLEKQWGKDPSKIVIDEIVGMWISLFMVPFTWQYVLAGFILFRFFDIFKPLYINKFENLQGGWGVMMDDVIAGIYANILLQITLFIF